MSICKCVSNLFIQIKFINLFYHKFLYIKTRTTKVRVSYQSGASDGNRTHVPALARPCTSRCTTPALDINIIYKWKTNVNDFNKILFKYFNVYYNDNG